MSRSRKKFKNVRIAAIAASWPIWFQFGEIAVRIMSAASANSKPKTSRFIGIL
jgi:hypothetical protein